MVNFGPLTKKLQTCMLTHPKSTMRVLRMLRHLSLGHVTLLLWEFPPQSVLQRRGRTHVGLSPKFLFEVYILLLCVSQELWGSNLTRCQLHISVCVVLRGY